jgi:hypothetical protein
VKARIQRLRAEIQSDWRAFEEQLEELASLQFGSLDGQAARQGELARSAVALHHGYGAVEGALSRLARVLGEGVPEGPDWHQALLHAMALEIEGVRPPVLSAENVSRLRRLLGFWHFFRHAYAVSLDSERLAALRDEALAMREPLRGDFARLDAFLDQLAGAAGEP